jgi:hypothetical protein
VGEAGLSAASSRFCIFLSPTVRSPHALWAWVLSFSSGRAKELIESYLNSSSVLSSSARLRHARLRRVSRGCFAGATVRELRNFWPLACGGRGTERRIASSRFILHLSRQFAPHTLSERESGPPNCFNANSLFSKRQKANLVLGFFRVLCAARRQSWEATTTATPTRLLSTRCRKPPQVHSITAWRPKASTLRCLAGSRKFGRKLGKWRQTWVRSRNSKKPWLQSRAK